MPDKKRRYLLKISTIIKYLSSVIIMLTGALHYNLLSLILGLVELVMVFIITNSLFKLNRAASFIWNCIVVTFINVQFTILRFAGSFFSFIMLTNINSISALSGKADIYLIFGTIAVIAGLLPVTSFNIPKKEIGFFSSIAAVAILIFAGADSPFSSFVKLGADIYNYRELRSDIINKANNGTDIQTLMKFYKKEITDAYQKPAALGSTPNIILIFTEGLSQNIIDDNRNIMPNVKEYESNSLFFTNYYNHTAATYRGISGQLFSSHQFNNYDENHLISLQSILKNFGYNTTFINAEPENHEFTDYLSGLGFDNVINTANTDRYSTDKEAYELLYETISASDKNIPQFIALYTFCTHISLNSDDEIYGDGSNILLNRFYNADAQYGNFMSKIIENGLTDNTVIIYTTDHASYCDEDFINTFYPDYTREDTFCDEIPLFIWYKGISPASVDVAGRNSLGLAPTILDFLDISSQNFFLGNSLFENSKSEQDILINTTFAVPDQDWTEKTYNDSITALTSDEYKYFNKLLSEYLSCTIRNENTLP